MRSDSKYQPLLEYLQRFQDSEVTLTFDEIEILLDGQLPTSARSNRAWWSNRTKGALQAKSWMQAGFLVEDVNFETGQVTFRKPPAVYKAKRMGDTVQWNGTLIRGLRRHLGLSQAEFAEKIGVRQQTISDWETNTYDPRRSMSKFLTIVAEQSQFQYIAEDSLPEPKRPDFSPLKRHSDDS